MTSTLLRTIPPPLPDSPRAPGRTPRARGAPASRLLLGLGLALMAQACAGSPPTEAGVAGPELRVLTYNIHHGRGADGRIDLERIATLIRAADPDVCMLQEVDQATGRSGGVLQLDELARLTDRHGIFARAIDHDGGLYGEGLLLRRAPLASATRALPHLPEHEGRSAAVAWLGFATARDGRAQSELVVLGTHLDHTSDPGDRLAQARALLALDELAPRARPVVLAGDLNAVPDSQVLGELLERFDDAAALAATGSARPGPTYPAEAPERRIDYVLVAPKGGWRVLSAEVLDEREASDHRPLLVVLEWLGAASE